MATEINKQTGIITTDDDWFWVVRSEQPATVKVEFTTAGSGGAVAVKDSQGDNYVYDKAGTATSATVAYNAGSTDDTGFTVRPSGGHINFTTSGLVAGSSAVKIHVIQPEGN